MTSKLSPKSPREMGTRFGANAGPVARDNFVPVKHESTVAAMASDLRELADTVRRLSSQVETLTRERDENREEITRMRALVVEHVSATRTMSRNVSSSNERFDDLTVRLDGRMESLQESVQHSIRDMSRMLDSERQARMSAEEALSSRLNGVQRQLADVAVIAASARAALDTAAINGATVIAPGAAPLSPAGQNVAAASASVPGSTAALSPGSPRRGKKAVLGRSFGGSSLSGSILGFDRGEPPELEPLDDAVISDDGSVGGSGGAAATVVVAAAMNSGASGNGGGRLMTRTAFEAAMGTFRTSLEGMVESRVRELSNSVAQHKALTDSNLRDLRRGLETSLTAHVDQTAKSLATAVAEVATNVAAVQAQADALQGGLEEEARRSAERSARCMEAVVTRYDSLGMQLQQTQSGVESRLNAIGDALLRGLAEEGELRESSIAALSASLRSELRDYSVKWRDFALSVESLRREVQEQVSKASAQAALDTDLSLSSLKATMAAHTTSHVSERVNAMRDETKALIQMALKDSVEPLQGKLTQDISKLNTALRDEIIKGDNETMVKVAALQKAMTEAAEGPIKALEGRVGQLETTAATATEVSALRAKVESGSALTKAELSAVQLYVGLLPQSSSSSSGALSPGSPGGFGDSAPRLSSPPLSPGATGSASRGLEAMLLSSAPPLLDRIKTALLGEISHDLQDMKDHGKKDEERISRLEQQNKSDDQRLSKLEEQNANDDKRISKLEEEVANDNKRLTEVEQQNKGEDARLTLLEEQQKADGLRLNTLEVQNTQDAARLATLDQKKDDERLSALEEQNKSDDSRLKSLEDRQAHTDAVLTKLSGENMSDDARQSRLEDQNKSDDERLTKLEALTTTLQKKNDDLQEQLDRHTEQLTECVTQDELHTMEAGVIEKFNTKIAAVQASVQAAAASAAAAAAASAPKSSPPPMVLEEVTARSSEPPLPAVKEKRVDLEYLKSKKWSDEEQAAALRIQSSAKEFLQLRRATRRQMEEPPAPAPEPAPAPAPEPERPTMDPDEEVQRNAAALRIQQSWRASKRFW
jgi:septal ring factor EnvC (AmiA/AmiB activator)